MNLAARLEGAGETYGTRIQISQSTVQAAGQATSPAAGEAAAPREIDLIRVAGRAEPVRIIEPPPKAQVRAPELCETGPGGTWNAVHEPTRK